jgi:hypothetical protein
VRANRLRENNQCTATMFKQDPPNFKITLEPRLLPKPSAVSNSLMECVVRLNIEDEEQPLNHVHLMRPDALSILQKLLFLSTQKDRYLFFNRTVTLF